jgi:hypothetical protein
MRLVLAWLVFLGIPLVLGAQEPQQSRSLVGGAWVSTNEDGSFLVLNFKKDNTFEARVITRQRQVAKFFSGKYRYQEGEWTLTYDRHEYTEKVYWVNDDEIITTDSEGAKSRWLRCKKPSR